MKSSETKGGDYMALFPIICDHKGCDREDTKPRFTARLRDIPPKPKKRERQPKNYCPEHRTLHPAVSPSSGDRIHPMHKSYEIVDGTLKPLRGGDIYGKKNKDGRGAR